MRGRSARVGTLIWVATLTGACGSERLDDSDASQPNARLPTVADSASVVLEERDEARGVHYVVQHAEPASTSEGEEVCYQLRLDPWPTAVYDDYFSEERSWSCSPRAGLDDTTDALFIETGFESSAAQYNHAMGTVAPEASELIATFDDRTERIPVTNGTFIVFYDANRSLKRLAVVDKEATTLVTCDVQRREKEDGFLVALCPAYRPADKKSA